MSLMNRIRQGQISEKAIVWVSEGQGLVHQQWGIEPVCALHMAHISYKAESGWYEKPRFCQKKKNVVTLKDPPIRGGCAAHSTTISKPQVIWRTPRCKILSWRGVIVPPYSVLQGVQVLQLTHGLFPRDQISLTCVLGCSQFCQGLCRFSGWRFFSGGRRVSTWFSSSWKLIQRQAVWFLH